MSRVSSVESFERVAFESAIREHPGCTTTAAAYTDWLIEHGLTPIGARRIVTRMVREVNEERQRIRVEQLLAADGSHAAYLRLRIRHQAGCRHGQTPLIEVVPGGSAAVIVGDLGWYVDGDGHRVDEAYDDEHIDYALRWIDGPIRVVCGAAWIEDGCPNRRGPIIV